jgi:L-threonylcarbamoyladenylate synthase
MNTSDIDITSFLEKYSSEITSTVNASRVKAQILSPTEEGLKKASERIQNGSLVAFPTETVYGLGANALDEEAVKSIFTTKGIYFLFFWSLLSKGRPLTDPLIVHVSNIEEALALTDTDQEIRDLMRYLTNSFWPGPLTCVVKADLTKIPKIITANTGYVGMFRLLKI